MYMYVKMGTLYKPMLLIALNNDTYVRKSM